MQPDRARSRFGDNDRLEAGLKQEMFGYVGGGYSLVLGRFEEALKKAGVDYIFYPPVRSMYPQSACITGS